MCGNKCLPATNRNPNAAYVVHDVTPIWADAVQVQVSPFVPSEGEHDSPLRFRVRVRVRVRVIGP